MDNGKIINDKEPENVTGGNWWPDDPGEDDYRTYFDFYCYDCGYVKYEIPSKVGKTCEEGYYFCPHCNRETYFTWKTVSFP